MKQTRKILALLCMAALLLCLSACGLSDVPLVKAALELSQFDSFRAEPELAFDVQVQVPDYDASLDLNAATSGHIDLVKDPTRLMADLYFQLVEGEEQHLLAYAESGSEVTDIWYSLDEGETWEHTTLEKAEDSEVETESDPSPSLSGILDFGKSLGESFQDFVKVGTEDVKASPADRYDASLSMKAIAADPEARASFYADLAESLHLDAADVEALIDLDNLEDVPLSLWLDQESGRLVKAEMDLGPFLNSFLGSGLVNALIAEQLGLEDFDMEIDVAQTRLSVTLSQFNELDPADFTPPAA